MDNLLQDTETFNDEPVFYCKHCLSLAIKTINGLDFCGDCGSVDIAQAHISEWEEKYKEKYELKYLNIKKNGSRNEKNR